MDTPFMIGVWRPTLHEAIKFVDDLYLGNNVVQFSPDLDMRGSVWVILRVTGDQKMKLIERGNLAKPKWAFLGQ